MYKVYVPTLSNGNCVYIQNSDTIRVYESTPRQNTTVNYIDYYIKSHYMQKEGSQTFGNMSSIPTCISSSNVTTDYVYRQDFFDILVVSLGLIFLGYFFVSKVVRAFFVGWRFS